MGAVHLPNLTGGDLQPNEGHLGLHAAEYYERYMYAIYHQFVKGAGDGRAVGRRRLVFVSIVNG